MMKRLLLALLVLGTASLPALAQGFDAELSITPSHVLPAVPARVRVVLTNRTDSLLSVPLSYAVVVRRSGGDIATVLGGGRGYTADLADDGAAGIGPRKAITIDLPYEPRIFGGNFTTHPVFQSPGEYRIQLLFFDDARAYRAFDAAWTGPAPKADEMVHKAVAVSREAIFRVDEPNPGDMEVWKALKERAPGGVLDLRIRDGGFDVRPFFERYPSSPYLAYLAIFYPTANIDDHISAITHAIAVAPDETDRQLLVLSLAKAHDRAAYTLCVQHFDDAVRHAEAAQRILREAIPRMAEPALRARAQAELDRTVTLEDLREMVENARKHVK